MCISLPERSEGGYGLCAAAHVLSHQSSKGLTKDGSNIPFFLQRLSASTEHMPDPLEDERVKHWPGSVGPVKGFWRRKKREENCNIFLQGNRQKAQMKKGLKNKGESILTQQ